METPTIRTIEDADISAIIGIYNHYITKTTASFEEAPVSEEEMRLRTAGAHALMAVITLPNPASVALHEALGFQKVGQLAEVGFKFKRWVDVGYWQLIFRK